MFTSLNILLHIFSLWQKDMTINGNFTKQTINLQLKDEFKQEIHSYLEQVLVATVTPQLDGSVVHNSFVVTLPHWKV